MDKDLIRDIATQIMQEQILLNWKFYLLILFLSLLASVAGPFLKSYFGKRGEALARKSDLDELLKELRKTTATTESIKTEIEKETWIIKEFNILRRQKLEELLTFLYEFKEYLYLESLEKLFDTEKVKDLSPLDRAAVLHKLYFSELDKEMNVLYTANAKYRKWIIEVMEQKYAMSKNGKALSFPKQAHLDICNEHATNMNNAIVQVEKKAKSIMDSLRQL